jgi:hypothetical protein
MSYAIEKLIKHWRGNKIDKHKFIRQISYLNNTRSDFYILVINKDGVNIAEKKGINSDTEPPKNETDYGRAKSYCQHLEEIANYLDLRNPIIIGVFVGDRAGDVTEGPTFAFQKKITQKNLLLPDIDMLNCQLYADKKHFDIIPYEKKKIKAAFVGSTTGGGNITIDKIKKGGVPRINSALFFKNNPYVDFRLSNIVQCSNLETEKFIKDNIYNGSRVSWEEQLKNRFIISMDGNGATCSRVNKTLMSNSVLLKYNSESILYFFEFLEPWKHFIPIKNDQEVLDVVLKEIHEPGYYKHISVNAGDLIRHNLHYKDIYEYTINILMEYSKIARFEIDEIIDAGIEITNKKTAKN